MGCSTLSVIELLLALQAVQANLVGIVRDGETGEPLAGAVVALTDLDRAVVTDADGRYAFRGVPAGPQHLTVRIIGYAERTLHALVPRQGELRIDISLRTEPIPLEVIEARRRVAVRGVENDEHTAFPDRSISIAAVRTHPLLSEPDVLQALAGGEVVVSAEVPRGVHIRGGASDQTAYLLDGVPVFSPYHAAGLFSAWNPDALTRLQLTATSPGVAQPDALSGVVAAVIRTPGSTISAQGSASTTQARITVDGPVGVAGIGFLLSLRSGFPSLIAPRDEASYLRGETGDRIAKLDAPALGARVRIIAYESENEIDASAVAEELPATSPDPRRSSFEWRSRSLGAEWTRVVSRASLRIQLWSAAADASALWVGEPGAVPVMNATRRDEGVLGVVETRIAGGATVGGMRFERRRTSYGVEAGAAGALPFVANSRLPLMTAFLEHARTFAGRTDLDLGASAVVAAGAVHVSPSARLRWQLLDGLVLSGGYARLHQFVQSLRNPESVVGSIFPVDLHVSAGAPGVPVARSDQGVIAAEYRPSAGVHLGVQAYARQFDGLLLVAPSAGEPFATNGFTTGSGTARGLSLDGAVSGARFGAVATYGWQRVLLEHGDSSYVPEHGSTHLLEAGVIVFPSATSSVRVGMSGALGRRTTPLTGGFEFESCNLLDQGCEFSGSPNHDTGSLGTTQLPAYLRVDLGVRKHWHIEVAGRDASIALFGTVTNLFGRRNLLTYSNDPSTGERIEIEMRPRAPLVVGLDWRF